MPLSLARLDQSYGSSAFASIHVQERGSPDNSACEGFFGRMKNEMFYGVSWLNVSIEEFIHTVEDYMVWYREKRIKISLGGLSPLEYRQKLGLSA